MTVCNLDAYQIFDVECAVLHGRFCICQCCCNTAAWIELAVSNWHHRKHLQQVKHMPKESHLERGRSSAVASPSSTSTSPVGPEELAA